MRFADWVHSHRRSILFLIAIVAIGGLFSATQLPVSLFPHVQFPRVRVTFDAGAQPARRMALQVTRPMELALRAVPGVRKIRSITSRGSSEIIVDFAWGQDMTQAMLLVESAVNQALPKVPAATTFNVARMEPTTLYPVIAYSLTSKTETPVQLRDIARFQLRPLLSTVTGVRSVNVQGGKQAEYRVTVDPARLRALNLTIANVARAVSAANVLQAVGRLQDHYQLYLEVSDTRFTSLDQIRHTILKTGANGAVTLGSVAKITHSTVPQWISIIADGKPAVLVNVFQQPGGNTVAIDRAVQAKLDAARSQLPNDMQIHKWYDQSYLVSASESSVRDAMIIGVLIAAAVLFFGLRSFKIMLIAMIAVPTVLASTVLLLNIFNLGFNIMTLGGMAAAIGLFIDDVVVISEHLIRRMRENKDTSHHVVLGAAREFTPPLAGSSLSTIIIFFPLAFLGGVTGAFFKALSLTMASGLALSFIVAWLAVPILALGWFNFKDAEKDKQERFGDFIESNYRKLMALLLRWPIALLALVIPLLVLGYVGYKQVGSGFLPPMDEGGFVMDFYSPPGTSLKETDRILAQVGQIIDADPAVATYSLRVGAQLGGGVTEAHRGDFFIQLKPFPRPAIETVMNRILTKVQAHEPSLELETFQLLEDIIGDLTAVPQPIDIKLFGDSSRELLKLAPKIAQAIDKVPGVVQVKNGIVISGNALDIRVDRTRASLEGVTPAAVTQQLQAYLGGVVTTKVLSGIKYIGVRVWVPKKMRTRTSQIEDLRIRAPDGHAFPLRRIASVKIVKGQPQITRENLKRMVAVTGRISGRDLGHTIADVKSALQQPGLIPGNVYYTLGGLYQQQQIAFRGLMIVFIAALALVFLLLLFLYERFKVVVSIILMPLLAALAIFFGLWITGIQLNIMAIMGMTMIIGIVTEVAIFYFSEFYELEDQLELEDAIVQAGVNRIQPIFLTTLAFILALVPLALNIGSGSALLRPLAVAIIVGLLVQMELVLVIMPVVYYVFCGRGQR